MSMTANRLHSLDASQTAYPERVAKILLVSPPWFLTAFFAVIRPILSQRTVDKARVRASGLNQC